MALMCPATTADDVDAHTRTFTRALAGLEVRESTRTA
jgi:hypothetical protein